MPRGSLPHVLVQEAEADTRHLAAPPAKSPTRHPRQIVVTAEIHAEQSGEELFDPDSPSSGTTIELVVNRSTRPNNADLDATVLCPPSGDAVDDTTPLVSPISRSSSHYSVQRETDEENLVDLQVPPSTHEGATTFFNSGNEQC